MLFSNKHITNILSDSVNDKAITAKDLAVITHHLLNPQEPVFQKDYQILLERIQKKHALSGTDVMQSLNNMIQQVPFKRKTNCSFTFIDLFAGIGGFRIALQNLGGNCVFSSEWDKDAQKTYFTNFGEIPFGDITLEDTKNYIPDNFDILCAGFPCQAFSLAGKKRGFNETRGTLFFDVAEIIKRKRPKAFFLENVKGLKIHDKGRTLEIILNTLKDLGYFVPEPQIINAMGFGVPQHRERIYIVGFRNDLGINTFSYPKPSNKKVCFADIKEKAEVSVKYYLSTQYLATLKAHKQRHISKGNGFGYEIISDDQCANAIVVGGMGKERNLVIDNRLTNVTPITKIKGEVNREGIRKMTPREWARLQGFPDSYKIEVADASAYKQFGNSVAVPAIEATAKQILKTLKLEVLKSNTSNMAITGNKGEWSEIYVLFKLLGEGKIYAGDENLNKISTLFYPILNIIREEQRKYEYMPHPDTGVVVLQEDGTEIMNIKMDTFLEMSILLFKTIKSARSSSFSIEEIEQLMKDIKCNRLKAKSSDKSDITIIIHDLRTGMTPKLGFSIKSQVGSPSTLLNPGLPTNILYKVTGNLTPDHINTINAISKQSARLDKLIELGGGLIFEKIEHKTFNNNLLFIDSNMPQILAECLAIHYIKHINSVKEVTQLVADKNILNYDPTFASLFYTHKIKNLLVDAALGMTPAKQWNGRYDANGGYIVVKNDGELVCYHFYNRNDIEDYLFNNTNYDNPSRSRYNYGYIFNKDGHWYMRLNLQIRFKH